MKKLLSLCAILLLFSCQTSKPEENKIHHPSVIIRTTEGDIDVELFPESAPFTVQNFLAYVDEKFYDQTIFHRVIEGFMIQGGGFTADMQKKLTHDPIRNEADNKVANERGTIAMARTSDVHSASSQFFINTKDNSFLNYRNPTPNGFGYCAFGKVTSGMDVVEKIQKVKTITRQKQENVPAQPITILEIRRKLK